MLVCKTLINAKDGKPVILIKDGGQIIVNKDYNKNDYIDSRSPNLYNKYLEYFIKK